MKILRRLEASPNPLLHAYTAATGRTVQDAVGDTATTGTPATWTPAPEYPDIWAALAVASDSNGVLGPNTPGLPAQAAAEGDLL